MPAKRECPGRGGPAAHARWTKVKATRFLEHLALSSNVSEAARVAGLTPSQVYGRKRRDAAFAECWRQALDVGFSELELLLLRHSLHGSERTEVVADGASGAVKQVKTVRSHPLAIAMRLHLAHRQEVLDVRAGQDIDDDDGPVAERVRAEMERVRARLAMVNPDGSFRDEEESRDGDEDGI